MGIYDRDYYQADEMRPLRPWDNKSMITLLIFANVFVHVINFVFTSPSNQIGNFLSLYPENLLQPWAWPRLVSYGFVHGGIFHLLFNMLTLYFLGRQVEDKYGRAEFLRIYLVMLALCGIGWCLLRLNAQEINYQLLGASGAVTGIAMLFVFSFPQATLMLYGILPVKAWVLGIGIVVMNVISSADNVAYDVHLMGAGLAAIYFFGKLNFDFMGGWLTRTQTTFKQKRRGFKVHRPEELEQEERAPSKDELEADRLLDKIHREGKDSLTAREQKFLEAYSRKVREQRK
jgi:membrane associated rhomboid family serine protease